jgi:allantoicase
VATQVRLDIYPDGGMARLRVFGRPTAAARAALADRFLRLLPESQLASLLRSAGLPADQAASRARARVGAGAEAGAGLAVLDGLPATTRELFRL